MSQSMILICHSDPIRILYGVIRCIYGFLRTPYITSRLIYQRSQGASYGFYGLPGYTPLYRNVYIKKTGLYTRVHAYEIKMTPYKPYKPYKMLWKH